MVEKKKCGPSKSEKGAVAISGIRLDKGPREIGVDLSGSSRSPISLSSPRVRVTASILPHWETQWRRMIAKHIFGRWTDHLRSWCSLRTRSGRQSMLVTRLGGVGGEAARQTRSRKASDLSGATWQRSLMNDQNRRAGEASNRRVVDDKLVRCAVILLIL